MDSVSGIRPSLPPSPPGSLGLIAGTVFLAAAYYAAAKAGLLLAIVGGSITLFGPPTGIAVAVLYRVGFRFAAGVFVGAVAVSLTQSPPTTAAGIAAGNTAAPLLAAWLLRRLRFSPAFGTWRDVVVLFGSAFAGMTVSAANGTLWVCGTGELGWDRAGDAVLAWWLGDVAGVVVVGPALLAWEPSLLGRMRTKGTLSGFLGATTRMMAVSFLLFGGVLPLGKWVMPLVFLPLLCAARTAALYRAWAASVQVLILAGFVLYAAHTGHGPVRSLDPAGQPYLQAVRPYLLWGYLTTASGLALAIAGLLAERDRVDRQVRASEAEYRAIVEDNPALIGRFQTAGVLTFVNETFRLTIGPAAAPGRNFYRVAGLDADPALIDRVRSLGMWDAAVTLDARAVAADGAERWFRWTVRAVDMASSVVTEFHAVGTDVTGQKRAEAERRAMEAHALQTQRLESVGVLAGGIAHEFNNILTGIIGNAELAQLTARPDDPVLEFVVAITAGANRAAHLTKQLLQYAGKGEVRPGPASLNDLVRGTADLLAVAVPKRCKFRYELADELPLIAADEPKVRQVLLSLVTNAGEAMADAPGTITVRTGQADYDPADGVGWHGNPDRPAGLYVLLEVADTGPGMPADVLARVFEPFFTTKFPGRGLGLPAVLGIVRDHAGAVRVVSEPGRGTTVTVLFRPLSAGTDHDLRDTVRVPARSTSRTRAAARA